MTVSEVAVGGYAEKTRCRLVISQIGQQLAPSQINDDRRGDRNVSSGKRTNGGFRARPGHRRAPQLLGSLGTHEDHLELLLSDRLVVHPLELVARRIVLERIGRAVVAAGA
jgi:hypothetical protein